MVDATVSGVAFAVNPVSGDRNQVTIEAAYGLSAVVSGKEADTYRARKSDGVETVIPVPGYKRMQVVPNDDRFGVQSVPVDRFLRKRRALSPDEVKKISTAVKELEQHFGYPVDVEFAITRKKDPDGKTEAQLFILQVRPITAETGQAAIKGNAAEPSLRSASTLDKKLRQWRVDRDHPRVYAFYTTVIAPVWESAIHVPVLAVLMYFSGPWAYLAAVGVNIVISWGFATVHGTATKKEWNTLFAAGLAFGGVYLLLPFLGMPPGWNAVLLSMALHSVYNILAPHFKLSAASIIDKRERVAGGDFRTADKWKEFRALNAAKPA
jgi:hypothetical protein